MKLFLIGKGLWEIVDGTETVAEDASEDARAKFKKRDNLALATVCLGINSDLHIYVRGSKTGKEAWEDLSKRFEEKTLSKKISYRRKLYKTHMNPGTDMTTHINQIKTISEHLEALDDPVVEKDLVMILISSWPTEYNNLITTLETLSEEKLTWNYVRDRAIAEYDRIKSKRDGSSDSKDAALNINFPGKGRGRGRGRGRGKIGNGPEKRSCHHCKEIGHLVKNCPKKKEQKKDDDAVIAVVYDNDYALVSEVNEGQFDDADDATTESMEDTSPECGSDNLLIVGIEEDTSPECESDNLSIVAVEDTSLESRLDNLSVVSVVSQENGQSGDVDDKEWLSVVRGDEACGNSQITDIAPLESGDDDDDTVYALAVSSDDALQTGNCPESHWWLDSGCSRHMTPSKNDFEKYLPLKIPVKVGLADESSIFGYGIGNIKITLFDGTAFVPVVIKNVLYVPKLKRKLLSITDITDRGSSVTFEGETCTVKMKDKHFLLGRRRGKLWRLHCQEEQCFLSSVGSFHSKEISMSL